MKFAYLRWMVRASVLWMAAGTVVGLLIMAGYKFEPLAGFQAWRTVHVHALLVGGILQLIMGVALWMFPRPPQGRGWPSHAQGWWLFTLMNAGTLLRSAAGPHLQSEGAIFWVGFAGALMQVAGFVLFGALVIPRIRGVSVAPRRSQR